MCKHYNGKTHCKRPGRYNSKGKKGGAYCSDHMESDMDVKSNPLCSIKDCLKYARYGYYHVGLLYCRDHSPTEIFQSNSQNRKFFYVDYPGSEKKKRGGKRPKNIKKEETETEISETEVAEIVTETGDREIEHWKKKWVRMLTPEVNKCSIDFLLNK